MVDVIINPSALVDLRPHYIPKHCYSSLLNAQSGSRGQKATILTQANYVNAYAFSIIEF